jgi:hypothetical protein
MWIAIILAVLTWIVNTFFSDDPDEAEGTREGGLIDKAADGIGAIGGSIVDWYNDEDVSTQTKMLTTIGAGYLLMPDRMNKAVEGISKGVSTVVEDVGGSLFDLLKKIPWYVWGLLAIWIVSRGDNNS